MRWLLVENLMKVSYDLLLNKFYRTAGIKHFIVLSSGSLCLFFQLGDNME